jgi:hypothetical protein
VVAPAGGTQIVQLQDLVLDAYEAAVTEGRSLFWVDTRDGITKETAPVGEVLKNCCGPTSAGFAAGCNGLLSQKVQIHHDKGICTSFKHVSENGHETVACYYGVGKPAKVDLTIEQFRQGHGRGSDIHEYAPSAVLIEATPWKPVNSSGESRRDNIMGAVKDAVFKRGCGT